MQVRDKEKYNAYMRVWNKSHPQNTKRVALKKDFGISLEYYYQLLDEQGSVCAICHQHEFVVNKNGQPFSLAVDHNHETGKVRGLLCMKCNRGLGLFQDNPALLQDAIKYLQSGA